MVEHGMCATLGALFGFHGCEGPQPSKVNSSITTIEALIRESGGRRSLGTALVDESFACSEWGMCQIWGLYWVPRLRDTAGHEIRIVTRAYESIRHICIEHPNGAC